MRRTSLKLILIPPLLVAIVAVGLWIMSAPATPAPKQSTAQRVSVEVAEARLRPMRVKLEAVGSLRAREAVTLKPELAGRVVEIGFEEGASVQKGALLFRIDDRVVAAELQQAEATLKLAQVEHARFARLAKTGAATRRLFEQAQASLGVARANADLARVKYENATIRAPFDGVMGLRNVSPGAYVNTGQELASIVSYHPMKLDISIPETRASWVHTGQAITVHVEALPAKRFAGRVYAIDPAVDVSGRALTLRAEVPNPEGLLKPGYFARVVLASDAEADVLAVPEAAIVPEGNAAHVLRVGEDNVLQMRKVALGDRSDDGYVAILSGLNAGDKVVVSGQMKLKAGQAVEVQH